MTYAENKLCQHDTLKNDNWILLLTMSELKPD